MSYKNYIHGHKCQYLARENSFCNKCLHYVKEHHWWHWFFTVTKKSVLRPIGFFDFTYCKICDNWLMIRPS